MRTWEKNVKAGKFWFASPFKRFHLVVLAPLLCACVEAHHPDKHDQIIHFKIFKLQKRDQEKVRVEGYPSRTWCPWPGFPKWAAPAMSHPPNVPADSESIGELVH